ncbi:MAG: helix-turn-helix transcriptional regulator [Cyanothece sp. SIO1E1]|nr:helix-turn-helix transcriptional regulator [Cyanothece sp. SIO1E1]
MTWFSPALERSPLEEARVIGVSPLLRELILDLVTHRPIVRSDTRTLRRVEVLLDLLETAHQLPLHLPLPTDPGMRRVALELLRGERLAASRSEIARDLALSARTLDRRFGSETGLAFGRWRQQARILHALRLLAAGRKVNTIAPEVGYETSSAFVAMFRRQLGA